MSSISAFKMMAKLIVVCLLLAVNQVYAGVTHGLQTGGFSGAASYGRDAGAGGFAGSSLVSPLASSGFASPYGAQGGNYLQGVTGIHQGSSAGFGGFGSSAKGYGHR
ncbi:hypothetical protein DAPPUDRAFT_302897 [Daphnia pulex]|uniref:Uncharacterized protein n=1 Tax=Daphnia pulex TaxID=6669 RepID=E9HPU9_DAPPU|nr:hypothetical protein DAPPUDRAFT_302897 [Daphnia pulex]|eukprot:EFX66238.1 hypothetical protein DAPPUDRAFT_302897 [Daphnia pulex]